MYLSNSLLDEMADAMLDYVAKFGKGGVHVSQINTMLNMKFSLPTDMSNEEFGRVKARAKDRGQRRDPQVAIMPKHEPGKRSFAGMWKIVDRAEEAEVHADLVIRATLTRMKRDGRNYRVVYQASKTPELHDRISAVRLAELSCEIANDDIKGIVRNDAYKLARISEMAQLMGALTT